MPLIILAAASGCVRYQEAPLSAGREAARFGARTLNDAGIRLPRRGGPWDCAALTRAALALNPELEAARAQLNAAQAAVITAGARPNPTLGLTIQNTSHLLQGMAPWSLGFSLDVPIETAGKRKYRIAQASAAARAAALQVTSAEAQVRSRVRKSLLDLYAASTRAQLLTTELQSEEGTLKAFEERVAAGEIARAETLQSRLLYNQSQLLLRDAERQKSEAQAGAADAIGIPLSAFASAALNLEEFGRPPSSVAVSDFRRRALLTRPDVLGALAEYAASEAALRLEIAKQYPDFHTNPGYLWDQGQNKWSVLPSLELPVFDHHRGPIAEAEAKRAVAAARFRAIQAKASGDVDRAAASFHGAQRKLETAQALLATQEKQKQSAEALLKSGEGDRLGVLSADSEYDNSVLARFDALMEVQRAFADLEDAANGGGTANR